MYYFGTFIVVGNDSRPFVLPYRTRLFFNVSDSSTFWLMYIYQAPIIYIHLVYVVTITLVFSLVFHVCGKMAALAFRIRNLKVDSTEDPRHTRRTFRNLVEIHLNIKWMAKAINDTFGMLLLEELGITTLSIVLSAYNIIVLNVDMTDKAEMIQTGMFATTLLLTLYGYCTAGEYLITECSNIHNAFYECQWYNLSRTSKKQLTIFIAASSKPLYLTGGYFYIFSMASFASVLKTTMAFLSMLRAVT